MSAQVVGASSSGGGDAEKEYEQLEADGEIDLIDQFLSTDADVGMDDHPDLFISPILMYQVHACMCICSSSRLSSRTRYMHTHVHVHMHMHACMHTRTPPTSSSETQPMVLIGREPRESLTPNPHYSPLTLTLTTDPKH